MDDFWKPKAWIAVVLGVLLLPFTFLYEPFTIPASSMAPTLMPGDRILVSKMGYGHYGTFGIELTDGESEGGPKLERGGVYVFYPPHKTTPYVKRLVGLPGDRLKVVDGHISINGQAVREERAYHNRLGDVFRESLGDESYFVQRLDFGGSLPPVQVVVPPGHYFFLGDSRDNSADSRVWGVVASADILGEVVYVF